MAGDGAAAKPLRVLIVLNRLMQGGLQEVMVLLASELARRGHSVRVFVFRPVSSPNPYLGSLERAGVPVVQGFAETDAWAYRLRTSVLLFGLVFPLLLPLALLDAVVRRRSVSRSIAGVYGAFRGNLRTKAGMSEDVEYALRHVLPLVQLTALAVRWRPSLVHAFVPEGVYRVRWWTRRLGLPMVFSDHAFYEREWQPLTASLRRAVPHLDGLTVLDESAARRAREVYGAQYPVLVAPQPVASRIPNGLPSRPVARTAPQAPIRLGCLARLEPEKGLSFLLAAMARLSQTCPAVELWLAGDGGLRPELECLRDQLGLHNRVHLSGWISGEQKARFLNDIDVLVSSSLMEGIPIAILEAMAHAKPVVATRVGAVSAAVVDGVTGLLVEPRDVDGLADALATLVRDPDLRARFGRAGRARLDEQFRLDVAVSSIEAYLRRVVQQRGRSQLPARSA